ncbi:immediate early response gene 2 protein [Pungitius pungitius]|uniref:immediate early response gene 2 protein n=1 Tax=Pungitius pungitius TaxID=134920 RepID=UPI002E133D50
MEVTAEAKRIMVVALGKLYSSRTQRGGLRLHRSLLLTLVMKSARDMYHAAQATAECVAAGHEQQQQQEQQSTAEGTTESPGAQMELQVTAPLDRAKPPSSTREEFVSRDAENKQNKQNKGNKENLCPGGTAQRSRKRRGKAATEPDFLPCKKAKLEQATCPLQLGGVNPLWLDYASCSNILGAPPPAVPVHRAIAAC